LLKWFEGDFTSKAIGPAKQFGSLRLNLYDKDIVQSGRWWAEILGVNSNGVDTILIKNIKSELTDLASIDVSKYPFLKLKLHYLFCLFRFIISILQTANKLIENVFQYIGNKSGSTYNAVYYIVYVSNQKEL
jgi:hypothetical protein